MARDPYSWAANFARDANASARQSQSEAQNALMSVFTEEAARQRPYSNLPVELARSNAIADRNQQDWYKRSDYTFNQQKQLQDDRIAYRDSANRAKAQAPKAIQAKINMYAKMYGEDPDGLMAIAQQESDFNPNAVSPSGEHIGIFQIGGDFAKDFGVTDPTDIDQNIVGAIRGIRAARQALTPILGREPTYGEIYVAHQQGIGGAKALFSNPNAPAGSLVPSPKNISQNFGNPNAPAKQFTDFWVKRIDGNVQRRRLIRSRSRGQQQQAGILFETDGGEQVIVTGESTTPGLNEPTDDDNV